MVEDCEKDGAEGNPDLEGADNSGSEIGGVVSRVRNDLSGVVLLSGCSGVGKSTAAEYLVEEYGAQILQVGDSLRNFLAGIGIGVTNRIDIWPTFAKEYTVEDIYDKVMKFLIKEDRLNVVDCVRFPQLFASYKSDRSDTRLLHIEAGDAVRFARLRDRMFFSGEATDDEMVRRKFGELEADIQQVMVLSDYLIENNGTRDELYRKLDRFISWFRVDKMPKI